MREGEGRASGTGWLAGLSALAVGASVGWVVADLVSSPSPASPERLPPERVLPRANTAPPHPVLPEPLARRHCRHAIVEGEPRLHLTEVATGLVHPTFLASPPGDPRLFVLEASGRVVIVEEGQARHRPFLDLSSLLSSSPHRAIDDRGFGALAFHPRYGRTGRIFLSHIDVGRNASRILEVHVSQDPDRADAASAFPLLEVPLPTRASGPATLAFGPEGYLYIGLGDGGEPSDPGHLAQRTDTLLGKILRIDVDRADPITPYALPEGNFRGPRVRGEIWALGVREPVHLGFDRETGDLWLTDLGDRFVDEIDLLPAASRGLNLGWSFVEGSRCVGEKACDTDGLEPPLLEVARGEDGCDLVGGYVYRGCRMPGLSSEYFFGDRCGRIRSVRIRESDDQPVVYDRSELPPVLGLRALGEDADGEIYVLSSRGIVYRLEPR